MSMAPNIYIENATLHFEEKVLFKNLTFTIKSGRLTCLLGRSGTGKTTLLRLIADLIPLDLQDTHFDGRIETDHGFTLKNNIAYLAQGDILLPWLNALDNAMLGTHLRGNSINENRKKATQLFAEVGLGNAQHKYPHELSGGMRQRVALIRTLLEEKPIVLMDEPFSQLDAITRYELQALTVKLLKNRTVFLVTHDPLEALRMADDIFILGCESDTLHSISGFNSSTPRNPSDQEVMKYHTELLQALTYKKMKTV